MSIEDDSLIQQAEAVVAEAVRLRQALEQSQKEVRQQVQCMLQIEAELDPLLPHPPEELREIRALLARSSLAEGEEQPAHAGQWRRG